MNGQCRAEINEINPSYFTVQRIFFLFRFFVCFSMAMICKFRTEMALFFRGRYFGGRCSQARWAVLCLCAGPPGGERGRASRGDF